MIAADQQSILQDFKCVLRNGWKNVTSSILFTKGPQRPHATARPLGTRSSTTPSKLFKSLFSPEVLERICSSSKNKFPINSKTGEPRKFALEPNDFLKYAAVMLLENTTDLGNQKRLRAFLSCTNFSGSKYQLVTQYLDADWEEVWDILSRNFQSAVLAGGFASLDETMWPWLGTHEGIVFIRHKPTPMGWKVITMCVRLAKSDHPFVLFARPDILGHRRPWRCLEEARQLADRYGLFVSADRWFGRMGWMETWCKNGTFTLGMRKDESSPLYNVMLYKLYPGHYRVFSKGNLTVSLLREESTMFVATSSFLPVDLEAETLPASNLTPERVSDIKALSTLSATGLKQICHSLGRSRGNFETIQLYTLELSLI